MVSDFHHSNPNSRYLGEDTNMENANTPNEEAAQQIVAPSPICPYCEDDPLIISSQPLHPVPGMTAVVFYCTKCRKTLNVQILHVAPEPRPTIMPGGAMPFMKRRTS